MKEEIEKLNADLELLNAMKKSVHESDQKFQNDFQHFLTKHLGIAIGANWTLPEVLKKMAEKTP